MNMLKIAMQGTWCWLDLNLIPLIMSWACFHALIYFLCRICILPFVLRVPIPPRSQLLITSILTVIHISSPHHKPGRVAQSVARLTKEPEVPGPNSVRPHTFLSPSAESRRTVVS